MTGQSLSSAEGSMLLVPSRAPWHLAGITLGELFMLDVLAINRRWVKKHKRDPRPIQQTFLEKGREWDNFHPQSHHEVILKKVRLRGAENILSLPRRLRDELGEGVPLFISNHLVPSLRKKGLARRFRLPFQSPLTPLAKSLKEELKTGLAQLRQLPPPNSDQDDILFPTLLKGLGGLLLLGDDMSYSKLGLYGKKYKGMAIADLDARSAIETGKNPLPQFYDWNGILEVPSWRFSAFLDPFLLRFMESLKVESQGSLGIGIEALDMMMDI